MKEQDFLNALTKSFQKFLEYGSRSNAKLKPLHSFIANHIQKQLGDRYKIFALGIGNDKEKKIQGRYIVDKRVDITIIGKNNTIVAGIGIKFVMQNYAQNANNYFENMLGETANIRANKIPYFQIFILFEKLPYYKKDKNSTITKWEEINNKNVCNKFSKYKILSQDNITTYIHTPNKTLVFVIALPKPKQKLNNKEGYTKYYKNINPLRIQKANLDNSNWGDSVIFNDYEKFIEKLIHYIKFI